MQRRRQQLARKQHAANKTYEAAMGAHPANTTKAVALAGGPTYAATNAAAEKASKEARAGI